MILTNTEETKAEAVVAAPVEPASAEEPGPAQPLAPTAGFLDENPGEKSAMRLMCLIALAAAVVLFFISAIGGLVGNTNTEQATQAAITLLSVAMTGKLSQKFVEK